MPNAKRCVQDGVNWLAVSFEISRFVGAGSVADGSFAVVLSDTGVPDASHSSFCCQQRLNGDLLEAVARPIPITFKGDCAAARRRAAAARFSDSSRAAQAAVTEIVFRRIAVRAWLILRTLAAGFALAIGLPAQRAGPVASRCAARDTARRIAARADLLEAESVFDSVSVELGGRPGRRPGRLAARVEGSRRHLAEDQRSQAAGQSVQLSRRGRRRILVCDSHDRSSGTAAAARAVPAGAAGDCRHDDAANRSRSPANTAATARWRSKRGATTRILTPAHGGSKCSSMPPTHGTRLPSGAEHGAGSLIQDPLLPAGYPLGGPDPGRWQPPAGSRPRALRATVFDRAGNSAAYGAEIVATTVVSTLVNPNAALRPRRPRRVRTRLGLGIRRTAHAPRPADQSAAQSWPTGAIAQAPFRLSAGAGQAPNDGVTSYGNPVGRRTIVADSNVAADPATPPDPVHSTSRPRTSRPTTPTRRWHHLRLTQPAQASRRWNHFARRPSHLHGASLTRLPAVDGGPRAATQNVAQPAGNATIGRGRLPAAGRHRAQARRLAHIRARIRSGGLRPQRRRRGRAVGHARRRPDLARLRGG